MIKPKFFGSMLLSCFLATLFGFALASVERVALGPLAFSGGLKTAYLVDFSASLGVNSVSPVVDALLSRGFSINLLQVSSSQLHEYKGTSEQFLLRVVQELKWFSQSISPEANDPILSDEDEDGVVVTPPGANSPGSDDYVHLSGSGESSSDDSSCGSDTEADIENGLLESREVLKLDSATRADKTTLGVNSPNSRQFSCDDFFAFITKLASRDLVEDVSTDPLAQTLLKIDKLKSILHIPVMEANDKASAFNGKVSDFNDKVSDFSQESVSGILKGIRWESILAVPFLVRQTEPVTQVTAEEEKHHPTPVAGPQYALVVADFRPFTSVARTAAVHMLCSAQFSTRTKTYKTFEITRDAPDQSSIVVCRKVAMNEQRSNRDEMSSGYHWSSKFCRNVVVPTLVVLFILLFWMYI